MKIYEQSISGVFIIEPEPFVDDRGIFRRHFCEKEFTMAGITPEIQQCNVSENLNAYTLRGFHYQLPPHAESKTLTCFRGKMYDIVVDLRVESPTYLKWIGIELTSDNRKSLHVPAGCANAFLTLEDDTLIYYFCSRSYKPELELGIRYNDPSFKFIWPAEPKFISTKDMNHPDYKPSDTKAK